jgi:hypothetical protein
MLLQHLLTFLLPAAFLPAFAIRAQQGGPPVAQELPDYPEQPAE